MEKEDPCNQPKNLGFKDLVMMVMMITEPLR